MLRTNLPGENPDVWATLSENSMAIFRNYLEYQLQMRKSPREGTSERLGSGSEQTALSSLHSTVTLREDKGDATRRRRLNGPTPERGSSTASSSTLSTQFPTGHELGGDWVSIEPAGTSNKRNDFSHLFLDAQGNQSQYSTLAGEPLPSSQSELDSTFPRPSSTLDQGNSNPGASPSDTPEYCLTCFGPWPCTFLCPHGILDGWMTL